MILSSSTPDYNGDPDYNRDVDELLSRERKLIPAPVLGAVKKYRSMALVALGLLSAGQLGVKSLEKDNSEEAVSITENISKSASILNGFSDAEKQEVRVLAEQLIHSDGDRKSVRALIDALGIEAEPDFYEESISYDGGLVALQRAMGFNRDDSDGFWGEQSKTGVKHTFLQ